MNAATVYLLLTLAGLALAGSFDPRTDQAPITGWNQLQAEVSRPAPPADLAVQIVDTSK